MDLRWVMIFNANLDKCESNRKTAQELRGELKRWEDDRKGRRHLVDDTEAHLVCLPFSSISSVAQVARCSL